MIYDKFPVSKGHCLIIPHRVYSNYFDSTEAEIEALNQLVFEAKSFLDEKYQPSGYNVGINCGEDAGQTVNHVHIHVIPDIKAMWLIQRVVYAGLFQTSRNTHEFLFRKIDSSNK